MSTLLVHITMQLAVLLTSLLVIHHRFEASHNQPVSIRIGLNTLKNHDPLTKDKLGAALPLFVSRKGPEWR